MATTIHKSDVNAILATLRICQRLHFNGTILYPNVGKGTMLVAHMGHSKTVEMNYDNLAVVLQDEDYEIK